MLTSVSDSRRGERRSRRTGGVLLTSFGCLLLAASRSTAFVPSATPGAFARRCGGGSERGRGVRARSASVVEATVVGSVARGAVASRRKTQLGMVEVSNNPITSRVFGKPDDDGRDRKNQPDMNEEIAASGIETVRCVISIKGVDEQLGILTTQEALDRAEDEGLDLVMISEDAHPPVVKIIDYGKFKYKQDRRKKENRAKHKAAELKEVKMSYKIETHDYGVRVRNARKFLTQGNRVRVVVQFRGREQSHMDLGNVLLEKVAKDVEDLALTEPKRREGNRLSMIVYPKPQA